MSACHMVVMFKHSNRIEFVRPAGFDGKQILDVTKQVTYMRYRDSKTMLTCE